MGEGERGQYETSLYRGEGDPHLAFPWSGLKKLNISDMFLLIEAI